MPPDLRNRRRSPPTQHLSQSSCGERPVGYQPYHKVTCKLDGWLTLGFGELADLCVREHCKEQPCSEQQGCTSSSLHDHAGQQSDFCEICLRTALWSSAPHGAHDAGAFIRSDTSALRSWSSSWRQLYDSWAHVELSTGPSPYSRVQQD